MSALFLDSNVLVHGIVAEWKLSRAVLLLCAARIHQLLLAEVVIDEVETALLMKFAEHQSAAFARLVLGADDDFLRPAQPKIVPWPSARELEAAQGLIHHTHDVPVLASAMKSSPDWLLTRNTRHFTPEVSQRTGLRIATPLEFFQFAHSFI
jgi:hypothetical protein